MHNAAGKGFFEIVQLLVEAGANVHIRADKVMIIITWMMRVFVIAMTVIQGNTGLNLAHEPSL